ncbi:hypothetical protein, partial [Escherichia coli]|uniref:hypothetical protein n=1 Tax=Escherichia coli TaxID=562 RepID=UPI00201A3A3C
MSKTFIKADRPWISKTATIAERVGGELVRQAVNVPQEGTVAKLAMRQPFVLFKGLTFQKLCLP